MNLLYSVANDERGSFDMFYNIYYEQVFRFVYYFLKDKESCREVVADVFYGIWQSRKRLKDIENINTYLYITARNKSIRFMKQNFSSFLSLEEIPILLEKSEEVSPEDEIINKEIETLLTKTINELPERCRIIFLMIRSEGLKAREVAEILSIKESTVRAQMKIAIEKITEAIKPYYPNLRANH
ncbi:MAG: RNA polymerase sigma-70 factor [Tannerellaceae bacterium]|jgi:RNA polymerase sigma-70 factor (ECF subfamily)|nr:RNA polymerase sigma-70 factor [Tannerellaceae bacterium]